MRSILSWCLAVVLWLAPVSPLAAHDGNGAGPATGPPEGLAELSDGFDLLASSDPYEGDPLGLIARTDRTMEHSLGEDVWEVWICDVPEGDLQHDLAGAIGYLEEHLPPYFSSLAEGRYSIRFVEGGIAKTSDTRNLAGRCDQEIHERSEGTANGAVILDDKSYTNGFGTAGWGGEHYPDNRRTVWASLWHIGRARSLLAHEVGHGLAWPHSASADPDKGDNPMDLMGEHQGRMIGTLVINRYAAGWIDPDQVVVHGGDEAVYQLGPPGFDGLQMLVLSTPTQGVFTVVGVRVWKGYDTDLEAEGVEVYDIDQRKSACAQPSGDVCWGADRRTTPHPPNASHEHVYSPGQVVEIGELRLEIGPRSGDLFTVTVRGCGGEYAGFFDIACSTFRDDIAWLAAEGITKGCNPPDNTLFCPEDHVTRGQMAAFLVRALGLTDDGGGDLFTDDDGSVFEGDIDRLATAGITKGCNPPADDRFCPDDFVTRGQMAAFLHRALGS